MGTPLKPRPGDDKAIAEMCAWLKANHMIGQTTLAGKLTLTKKEDLIYDQYFRSPDAARGL